MLDIPRAAALAGAAGALALAPAALAFGPAPGAYVLKDPLPLSSEYPGIVEGGHSGLFPAGLGGRAYWTITDRGPNGQVGDTRTFPVPAFAPEIKLVAALPFHGLTVLAHIPLRLRPDGQDPLRPVVGGPAREITGFANLPVPADELAALPDLTPAGGLTDPYGLDTEGIALSRDGTFWLADEYRPSLVQVSFTGTILQRLVPQDTPTLGDESVLPVRRVLPAIYSTRRLNRGFEGVAVSGDGRFVYGIVQNSLAGSPPASGNALRLRRSVRIAEVRVKGPGAPELAREFIYRIDENATGKPSTETNQSRRQDQYRIGDLYWRSPGVLWVAERDDLPAGPDSPNHKLVYEIRLDQATDLTTLAGAAAVARDNGSLDGFSDTQLADAGVAPTPKAAILDVGAVYPYAKLEGMTPAGRDGIAVVNDNDFAVAAQTATAPPTFEYGNPDSELTIFGLAD